MERHFPSQCRSSSKPWWALRKDTHSKPEDTPNTAAEGTQPAPTEGSADTAPPASDAKATEALLPSLTIWPPSQRTRDTVVCYLMQTLAAPSVLSQLYGLRRRPGARALLLYVQSEMLQESKYFEVQVASAEFAGIRI
ncbi:WPP domain-containing protein 1-like [Panicum virgatum]|uniref:WPP domain-containing protein 1-like n=1 Tax=Panicum virgatum TaxID=38727 RepID=UPI0019D60885|nr:WPP domain-containing protein 1-like [Panicum virgatum]